MPIFGLLTNWLADGPLVAPGTWCPAGVPVSFGLATWATSLAGHSHDLAGAGASVGVARSPVSHQRVRGFSTASPLAASLSAGSGSLVGFSSGTPAGTQGLPKCA